ncbi:phosphoglycerate kinase, partial [bacterium]|nr:phosphoglycerate kinase [bacterium]
MKLLKDVQNLKGVKVLARFDFNVPVSKGRVVDSFRICRAMPTINFLKEAGAKTIILSHIETLPEDGGPTLLPVVEYLKTLGVNSTFVENYRNAMSVIESMSDGDVVVLENIRVNEGEKKNDKKFARELASLGDIYVNDAFSVSHREHASVVAITEFIPSYAGLLMEEEVKYLSSAFHLD